jgi:hypothetical protein
MRATSQRTRPMNPTELPGELLALIVDELPDEKALHTAALVSRAFNQAATRLLYRSLHSRTIVREYGVRTLCTLVRRAGR